MAHILGVKKSFLKLSLSFINYQLPYHIWYSPRFINKIELDIKVFNFDINLLRRLVALIDKGGFHLHLLVFPFFYQFDSRIGVLVQSSFANEIQKSFNNI